MSLHTVTLNIRACPLDKLKPAYRDFDALMDQCIDSSIEAWEEHLNSGDEDILPCFVTATSLTNGKSLLIDLPFGANEEKWAMFAAVKLVFAEEKVDFYVIHSETTARTEDHAGNRIGEPRDTLTLVGATKDGRVRLTSLAFKEKDGHKTVYREDPEPGDTSGELTKFLTLPANKAKTPNRASWI